MNLNGPFHRFVEDQKTNTGQPNGTLRNPIECSFPFCTPLCLSQNAIFLRACSFSTSSLIRLSNLALSICEGTGGILAGHGIAPNTNSAGHKPFGPTLQLMANNANCKHSWSLVWRSVSARIFSNAFCKGTMYLLTILISPGVSIGVSSRLTANASNDSSIYFDVYADHCSTTR